MARTLPALWRAELDIFQAVILAAIQGITEFLPISSSGHLILPSVLLGWSDQGLAFDVALHVGSLVAVLWYFRRDIRELVVGWLRSVTGGGASDQSRLAWYIVLATIPACLAALVVDDLVEQYTRNALVLGATSIIFGLLLGVADWRGRRDRDLLTMTWQFALFIGLMQALALIPGTSRSGITMTAALLLGFNREASARFSFLLSIPLIIAAGVFKGAELAEQGLEEPWSIVLLAVLVSAVTAYLCISLFLGFINRIGMQPFVIYRLLLGGVLIALWAGAFA
jgi:undecaprenyl-diphosphatase